MKANVNQDIRFGRFTAEVHQPVTDRHLGKHYRHGYAAPSTSLNS